MVCGRQSLHRTQESTDRPGMSPGLTDLRAALRTPARLYYAVSCHQTHASLAHMQDVRSWGMRSVIRCEESPIHVIEGLASTSGQTLELPRTKL